MAGAGVDGGFPRVGSGMGDSLAAAREGGSGEAPGGAKASVSASASAAPTPVRLAADEVLAAFARHAARDRGRPKLVIDGHCQVLWESPHARHMLQPPLPLSIEGRLLRTTNGGDGGNLSAFVENLDTCEKSLFLGSKAPNSWVLLRGWSEWRDDSRLVFLDCALSKPLCAVGSSGMAEQFGLTPKECAVLDLFAQLIRPNEIAERLGVSINTVRSHLKQIHVKVSVNSSAQLLKIAHAYCEG